MAKLKVRRFRVHLSVMVRGTQHIYFQPSDTSAAFSDLEYEIDTEAGLMKITDPKSKRKEDKITFVPMTNVCQFWLMEQVKEEPVAVPTQVKRAPKAAKESEV